MITIYTYQELTILTLIYVLSVVTMCFFNKHKGLSISVSIYIEGIEWGK